MIAMAVFGGDRTDANGRVVLVGLAVVLAFLVWRTDYSTKAERKAGASVRGEDIGRAAGRLTGNAVKSWRDRRK